MMCKIVLKLLVIKEIRSWLPPYLEEGKVTATTYYFNQNSLIIALVRTS